MKLSTVLVRRSLALLLAVPLAFSASSRAEIVERIVARVNGDIVTLSEFESRQLAAVQSARIGPGEVESYLRQNNARILQEAVDDLLIVQRAADLGIRLRPEYVQDVIEGIKKENNIADDAELRAQLRREGMSLDDLKRNIERSVLRRQVLSRELEPKGVVTDAEVLAEYQNNRQKYGKSASVHLQEIVVADRAQAEDVIRRAKGGEDFEAMARALSTAASRSAGGDLGQVARGDLNPELEKVVFALPAGGISEPLATDKGFRVLRVVAKEEAVVTPFEQVREEIKRRMTQERMSRAYDEYVEGLRTASKATTQVTVSEVSVQVPDLPAGPSLTSPGLSPDVPQPPGAEPAPAVPALPGIDASEISTTPQARPERVVPPSAPAATPSPTPTPTPTPSPSPQG